MPYAKKYNVKRKTKRSYTKKSGLTFDQKVKKIVQGEAEKKSSGGNPIGYTFSANNSINPVPVSLITSGSGGVGAIALGISDGQRVGNKMKVTKATLKLLATSSGIQYPAILQVMIGTVKGDKLTAPTTSQLDEIYQDGLSAQGFDPTRLSLMRNVNRDLFNIHRSFQIKVGPADASTVTSNNDFPFMVRKSVNLTPLLGQWSFNDTDDFPSNKGLYIWCHWVAANTGTSNSSPPELEYYTVIEYTDI